MRGFLERTLYAYYSVCASKTLSIGQFLYQRFFSGTHFDPELDLVDDVGGLAAQLPLVISHRKYSCEDCVTLDTG